MDCAEVVSSPYLSVARERYDRASACAAVESRDAFLDLDLVAFCVGLPGEQRVRDGWPKHILRAAMRDRLPEAVRRRPGKEHLGWAFTAQVLRASHDEFRSAIVDNRALLEPYVKSALLEGDLHAGSSLAQMERWYEVAVLGSWLRRMR
jgi:asparagine synthase (glutamine-hydrolysing)